MQRQGQQLTIEEFTKDFAAVAIVDASGNSVVFQPSNHSIGKGSNGEDTIGINISNKDRFLYELLLLSNNKQLTDRERTEVRAAIQDLTIFLKDLTFEFKDGGKKEMPDFRYDIADPKPLMFYADAEDPDYVRYLKQLALLNEYRERNEPVPDELQSYCEQSEVRFFAGEDNERLRRNYMRQAVHYYIKLPLVYFCVYRIIYSQEELQQLLSKPKRPTKAKKIQRLTHPFFKSGHLVDQQLKYNYPPDNTGQVSLFDSLQDHTQKKISAAGIEQKTIVEGIRLSPSETKVIDSLCKFLNLKSQTTDPEAEDYFAGNFGIEHVAYGGEKAITPKLMFTIHEVTREYKGGEAPSGKESANVKAILTGLAKKHFLIRYVRNSRLSNGNQRGQTLEVFQPLIKILKYIDEETDTLGQGVSRTEQMVVVLNPIFVDQIKSKFIEYPGDINRRTIIAYGSHNLSEAAIRLRDHLMREKSSKRFKPEMTHERLYYFLCEKWMQEGRRKKVIEYTEKAIETVTALGLITRHEILPAKQGKKYVFHIDKDWK